MTTPATSGQHKRVGARIIGPYDLKTNSNSTQSGHAGFTFDSNAGWGSQGDGNTWQSWMWKKHSGLTVCAYTGDGVSGRQIPHDLSKTPEMIWVKRRTGTTRNWPVYHSGINGGSSPHEYTAWLNLTNAQQDETDIWNDTAPDSSFLLLAVASM